MPKAANATTEVRSPRNKLRSAIKACLVAVLANRIDTQAHFLLREDKLLLSSFESSSLYWLPTMNGMVNPKTIANMIYIHLAKENGIHTIVPPNRLK
mmetsp:Transcript_11986/g.25530  ORF Transcript_11986/g.25530 Transcript_11986/m.25530 type:complete len:97 (+) Transcript_11986:725-1015(+)